MPVGVIYLAFNKENCRVMFSMSIQFSTPGSQLSKTVSAVLVSTLLLLSYNEPVLAACDGPYGTPGLDLPPELMGEWGEVLDFPVQATHSVGLSSGKVLFWRDALPAYLFDPKTDTYAVTSSPAFATSNVDFFCSGHATMADGRVMVVGGTLDNTDNAGISDAFMFSPVTETWEMAAPMAESRWYPSLTTMLDGRMLVNEGIVAPGPNNFAQHPEIYDPATDTWTSFTSATRIGSSNRLYPFMYALSNGNALMAGAGAVTSLDVPSQDPVWSWVTRTLFSSSGAVQASAMYLPDHILKIGSLDPDSLALDRAEVLDMTLANPVWREVSPMNYQRIRADAVLLPDGTVLISGGARQSQNDPTCAVHAAEIWDPVTEAFTVVASHNLSRIYHSTSVLLPDGRVYSAGGEGIGGVGGLLTAEIYSPPYLFKGPRPIITSVPAVANYGTSFQLNTSDAASIVKVSALRPAATTHNGDQNQRYIPLDFVIGSGALTVTAPAANVTPPGDYMVFLVNGNGAVSESTFMRLEPTDSDADGVLNNADNCTLAANGPLILDNGNNSQLDTDSDGFGNLCDGDLNNDNTVNVQDLGLFKARFFTGDVDADMNGDGTVNVLDLGLFKAGFFMPPGPSGPLP